MARSEVVIIPEDVWTQITNADVSSITFQNQSDRSCKIIVAATVGETPPLTVSGVSYDPDEGEYDLPLTNAFLGVSGANRVWVYATIPTEVFVSHA